MEDKIDENEEFDNESFEIKLGDYNTLSVVKEVDFGLYLDGGRDGEILMPKKYVPEGAKPGDKLKVFIYLDSEERPVATTETPLAKVGDFAWLKVSWVNQFGAFLNWGVEKDMFCPFREMKMRMQMGQSYLVYIHVDLESYRLVATAKIDRYIEPVPPEKYLPGDEVQLLVWQKTDLGFKVIIDNLYQGLIYEDQIFQVLHSGDRLSGFIDQVRPDGKIDVCLQQTGKAERLSFAKELLQYLQENDGYCDLGDKSAADDVYERFHVSKKVFKKGIGELYKKGQITVSSTSVRLVDK
ncbi:MAG: S1-like domain-containing RNA-binding protein [Prevotella sp.]|jgi:predicted RNA-binding protein (virulence factor B family)|nr:S1-like domain-containing RNA-binding protein [Prevotella sp.]MCH4211463.1 S1-like domain-containing RNA-binding protein [Prevotella sp.]MCH4240767.1 S1-like domain-containing RNA-binding protein [Prevotella sp.]